jgi:hypothetical protein
MQDGRGGLLGLSIVLCPVGQATLSHFAFYKETRVLINLWVADGAQGQENTTTHLLQCWVGGVTGKGWGYHKYFSVPGYHLPPQGIQRTAPCNFSFVVIVKDSHGSNNRSQICCFESNNAP